MSEETPNNTNQNPSVEGEVPGYQNLREANTTDESKEQNTDGALTYIEEYQNGGNCRVVKRSYTETSREIVHGNQFIETTVRMSFEGDTGKELKEEVEERKPKTKIPKLKFRQTVEKVQAAKKFTEESQKSKINRRSKISPPTTKPIVTKRNSALMDDEFEKIYEDLIDEQFNFDDQLLGDSNIDEEKIEMKFEEIVHDYDENKIQPINVEAVRKSRLPYRRQQSEQSDGSKDKKDTHGNKTGSGIPLLRSKSVHDTERSTEAKSREDGKEKPKYTSSIPLPRRKSGQDSELSKTIYNKSEKNGEVSKSIYNKSEKDGIITETVTTITKSAPVTITLKRGDVSTTYETGNEASEQSQNPEVKTKIRKSIPRLIGSKNDGRKVIRAYTRTVTTEKVENTKDKNSNDINIDENPETQTSDTKDETKIISTTTTNQKENYKSAVIHSQQEENIVKDSIKIGIPSFESKSETNEENIQKVEVTKILEWNTNTDESVSNKISSPKLKSKHEIVENLSKNEHIADERNIKESVNISQSLKSDTQNSVKVEESKSLTNTQILKETSEVSSTTSTDTFETPTSSETVITKEVNLRERDGSRFNKVSNLTILKGIDNDDEILTSPRLLISKKTERIDESNSNTSIEVNLKTQSEDTKVLEVLKSPKLDKDSNVDLLPEYNIRIKRFSKEIKHSDESLKQWQGESAVVEKLNTENNKKYNETNISAEKHITRSMLEISSMDNARNLLSRVLDREKRTETIKSKEEVKQDNKKSTIGDEKVSLIETIDTANKRTDINLKNTKGRTEISKTSYDHTKSENYQDIKNSVEDNKEDMEEILIKGKVGRLINKIDGKEFSNDIQKKEEEVPVRRSVLSKVAIFERQEPLDTIKARKPRQESKPPKLIIKEAQSPTHVHVHTPKIVEEVLKSADCNVTLNKNDEKTDIAWQIDFDKIILDRSVVNYTNINDNSENITAYQGKRAGSKIKDEDVVNNKTNVTQSNSNFKSDQNTVEIKKETYKTKDTIITTAKFESNIQISDDYNAVNLVQNDNTKPGDDKNKLGMPAVKDMATSPIRLTFDANDFANKVKNQVLIDAPVIIVHSKSNDNLSKSTEAIFSTQAKMDTSTNKKVDRTTSMTEKLYPEKVKANIALYESIKNNSYLNTYKPASPGLERATSTIIFETYKNERYAKANKMDRAPYTPQNSVNNDFNNEDLFKKDNYTLKYESSISVDESRYKKKTENSNNSESIIGINKSIYRITFDDDKSTPDVEEKTQSVHIENESNEKLGITPINEITSESYEIYDKNEKTNRKFRRFRSKYDEYDETGEQMLRSLPIIESGESVKDRVRKLSRVGSVDKYEEKKDLFNNKERPRRLTVLERIALFEGKAQQSKAEQTTIKSRNSSTVRTSTLHHLSETEYLERIEALKTAREKYGTIEEMPSLTLRNEQQMPVLAIGTAMLDPRLLKDIIGAAIDLGYRAIDTGYIYGNEKEVGEAIRSKIEDGTVKREDLFIIGKLWSTFHRTDLVETACRASLDAMGLKYFDLYLIHNPMSLKEGAEAIPKIATVLQYSQYDYLDAWYGMETLISKGLAKSIGVSNFNSVQIQRIMDKGKVKPSVNQVECHPYLSQQRLDQFCAERNIKLSCFGTLGSKGTPDEYKASLTPVIDDALVKVMASGLNVTPAQLLIRYQLECDRAVVVKASSAAHLWDNLQALTFNLTSGQVEALHALNRNKRTFTFFGMGDTHKNYPFKIAF